MFDGRSIDPRLIGERQKTFSSCFENPTYDERKFIELVLQQTGAERNYTFPQGERLFKDLSRLIWHQDEPFGSTSIYAQWSVMEAAKEKGITVLLDGQGGDELLAGYFPSFYSLLAGCLKQMEIFQWLKELKGLQQYHGRLLNQFLPGMLMALFPPSILSWWSAFSNRKNGWAEDGFQRKYSRSFPAPKKFENELNNYLYRLFRFFALPGLLHYEDRNSMAFSIETRLPFLDFRLVEYLFSLPADQKIKEGVTKVILRKAMEGVLPEAIRNRRDKIGFITPEALWLRTVLRGKIDELLGYKSFAERGFFAVNRVKDLFRRYCQGKVQDHAMIWRWINLELWFRIFIDKETKRFPKRGEFHEGSI
jgi:asparagine synthase (glutamine-hydrolysing)